MIATKRPGRQSKNPGRAELEMRYQIMTAPQMAEYYGVKESTVRNWIRQLRKEDQARDGAK